MAEHVHSSRMEYQWADIVRQNTRISDPRIIADIVVEIICQELTMVQANSPKMEPGFIYAPYIPLICETNPCGEIILSHKKPVESVGKILYDTIVDRNSIKKSSMISYISIANTKIPVKTL